MKVSELIDLCNSMDADIDVHILLDSTSGEGERVFTVAEGMADEVVATNGQFVPSLTLIYGREI